MRSRTKTFRGLRTLPHPPSTSLNKYFHVRPPKDLPISLVTPLAPSLIGYLHWYLSPLSHLNIPGVYAFIVVTMNYANSHIPNQITIYFFFFCFFRHSLWRIEFLFSPISFLRVVMHFEKGSKKSNALTYANRLLDFLCAKV